MHGQLRDRALRVNGFDLQDRVPVSRAEEAAAPMVPHVLRQGPPPMVVQSQPEMFALSDDGMETDDLERARAPRRRRERSQPNTSASDGDARRARREVRRAARRQGGFPPAYA